MKKIQWTLALLLVASMIIVGCGGEAAKTPAPEAPAVETPAPAVEPAPVAEAPAAEMPVTAAAPAAEDDWAELEIGSISGSQDLGLDMEEAPAADATTEAPAADAPAAEAGAATTYALGPNEDSVLYWTGYKPAGARQGGFNKFSGTATVSGDDFTTLAVDVTVDVTSMYADAGGVEDCLNSSDFLNPEKFPTAKFVSTKVEKTTDGYNVTGDFTFLAVTKSLTLPCALAIQGDKLSASAEVTINRRDWGMKSKSWSKGIQDTLIKDNVDIGFEILAPKQ